MALHRVEASLVESKRPPPWPTAVPDLRMAAEVTIGHARRGPRRERPLTIEMHEDPCEMHEDPWWIDTLCLWSSRLAPVWGGYRSHYPAGPLPSSIGLPLGEVIARGALGRQVVRKHVPLAPGAVEEENGIEDFSHLDDAWPSRLINRD
jgi:hypothetical protein